VLEVPYYNRDGERVGVLEVDESVFGTKVRRRLLHRVVIAYEANRRRGTHSTKTRKEVSYSDRKPWPQKHTGRARAGSRASPIWRHGGIAHGPKPRSYRQDIPRRERREALRSALLGKLRDGEVHVIEGLDMERPSTKRMAGILTKIGLDRSVLIGTEAHNRTAYLAARNLPRVWLRPVAEWNAYDVLRAHALLLTRAALDRLGPKNGTWVREPGRA
jgi:large subunit ribosomal protein L4